jgi:hypothetical protein
LSVTPTKFDVRAMPGQTWTSEIRVINSNDFEFAVFAEVVNFAARGDSGEGQFQPVLDGSAGQTFAEWVEVPAGPIMVAPEQSAVIPLTVRVPRDAPPGGHYAAVMISTQPPVTERRDSQVRTAQAVTSLLFLKVDGDIVESGTIREFTTNQSLYRSPAVDFTVRFENQGNVHIQPRGDITITNMWGQERGIIPINQRSTFGDVLPEQIRRFTFGWTGEWSLADIGRYEAVVNLAYGEQSRQFATSRTYFWVVPWHWALGIVLGLLLFIGTITWAVRQYITRMLILSGIDPTATALRSNKTAYRRSRVSVMAPLETGMLDLRSRLRESTSPRDRLWAVWMFVQSYWMLFVLLFGSVLLVVVVWSYVRTATVDTRPYEVRIDQSGETITVPAASDTPATTEASAAAAIAASTAPTIAIINQSGVTGTGARLRTELEALGYTVITGEGETAALEQRTFIVYGPRYKETALALSALLGNILISAYEPANTDPAPITIYVGADRL